MSRSRRKPKVGICVGSNTNYYRKRRRRWRRRENNKLKSILSHNNVEDASDLLNKDIDIPKHNPWDEPTDGSYMLNKNDECYEKYCRK